MTAFSRTGLLLRNLRYFRAANVAVVAGMAVATAVLAGALMVGDSVRASLRELAERRLDFVDHAMMTPRFVEQSLANRLAAAPEFGQRFESVTAGVTLRGGVAAEGAGARVAGVQITALAERQSVEAGRAVVNVQAASGLGAAVGGPLRFSLPAPDEAPRDATLARRGRNDTITTFNVGASRAAEIGGFADLFNLAGGQRPTPGAWVNLGELQTAIEREGQGNLFLVSAKKGHETPADAEALNQMLRGVVTKEDFGLEQGLSADKRQAVLSSKATYVLPAVVDAATKVAAAQHVPLQKVSVYLVNHVIPVTTAAQPAPPALHYAIAAGIDSIDGQALAADEIAVNQWTADQMKLKAGDTLRLAYYQRQANGDLAEVASDRAGVGLTFRVAKILPMTGIGADPSLTPQYKGLTDADTIADWRPPAGLNIDKKLVTKEDERYWSKYRAAPKLFVS